MKLAYMLAATLTVLISATAGAADLTVVPTSVSLVDHYLGDPYYSGDLASLNDGVYPPNETDYQTGTVHDFPQGVGFRYDFGSLTPITAYNLTVDNNDDYSLVFLNGDEIIDSTQILSFNGQVEFGLETFSSSKALPGFYDPTLIIKAPLYATAVEIYAANGDQKFAIGEAEFFTGNAVPEPATWISMIMGIGIVGGAGRKRRQRQKRLDIACLPIQTIRS